MQCHNWYNASWHINVECWLQQCSCCSDIFKMCTDYVLLLYRWYNLVTVHWTVVVFIMLHGFSHTATHRSPAISLRAGEFFHCSWAHKLTTGRFFALPRLSSTVDNPLKSWSGGIETPEVCTVDYTRYTYNNLVLSCKIISSPPRGVSR